MAKAQIVAISRFANPVNNAPGGSDFPRPGQRHKVSADGISAIKIASDSEVDVMDVYVDGRWPEVDERIRVSVEAPWIGRIDPGQDLIFVPVRGFLAFAGLSGDNPIAPAESPRLKCVVYSGCDVELPTRRAPLIVNHSSTAAASAAFAPIVIAGRKRTSIAIYVYDFVGAATVTPTIYTSDNCVTPAGVVSEIETATSLGALTDGTGTTYQIDVPYDQVYITLTPNAGTFSYYATISSYDD
jgi:hypothetical protein